MRRCVFDDARSRLVCARLSPHEPLQRRLVGTPNDLGPHLLVFRSLTPPTVVLPTVPRPLSFLRCEACMFFLTPPMYISSTSTGPLNSGVLSSAALRSRWSMNHAAFFPMPSSRWSFIVEMPLRFVVKR